MAGTHVTALTTTATAEQADRLARDLVERRLAACVQVVPIASHYRWEGRVHRDDEHLLIVKTTAGAADALAAHLRRHHPYEVPELVVLPVVGGLQPYLDWVAAEVEPAPPEPA